MKTSKCILPRIKNTSDVNQVRHEWELSLSQSKVTEKREIHEISRTNESTSTQMIRYDESRSDNQKMLIQDANSSMVIAKPRGGENINSSTCIVEIISEKITPFPGKSQSIITQKKRTITKKEK